MSDEILFLCPHGGAKSVIAATYLNQAGLPFTGVAAAAEDPYDAVPAPVVELLGAEAAELKPRSVEPADLERAARVIVIGCNVDGVNVERWDDVPNVSDDFDGSVAAIRRHVDALVAELRG